MFYFVKIDIDLIIILGNLMFSLKPDLYEKGILPRGNPELKSEILLIFDSQKTQNILGIEYRSLEESTLTTLAEYEKRGLLGQK